MTAKRKATPTLQDLDEKVPHNIEAERSVLASIMLANDCLPRVRTLISEERFFNVPHRRIFRTMVALADRGVGIDPVTVKDDLVKSGDLEAVGGPAYIASLLDGFPHSSNVEFYADIVFQKSVLRDVMQGGIDIAHAATNGHATSKLQELAANLYRAALEIESAGPARASCLADLDVAAMLREGIPEVAFDLEDFLVPRTLTYLSGAPKTFKTWLALAMSIALASGRSFAGLKVRREHRVLFVEAESTLQIPGRFEKLCRGFQVDPAAMLERVRFVCPARGLRLDDPGHAEFLKRKARDFGAAWVVIDSFVRVHGLDENSSADMARLANGAFLPLRDEVGCGVLVLDHPPKPFPGGQRGRKEQIRGSWEKLAAADVQVHVDAIETPEGRLAAVSIAASRVAPERDEPLFIRLRQTSNGGLRFEECEAPDVKAPGRPAKGIEQAVNVIRAEMGRRPDLTFTEAVKAVMVAGLSEKTGKRAWKVVKGQGSEGSEMDSTLDPGAAKVGRGQKGHTPVGGDP